MWTLSGFSDEISPEFEEQAPYIRIFLFFISAGSDPDSHRDEVAGQAGGGFRVHRHLGSRADRDRGCRSRVVRFESGALGVLHATTAAFPGLSARIQAHGDLRIRAYRRASAWSAT